MTWPEGLDIQDLTHRPGFAIHGRLRPRQTGLGRPPRRGSRSSSLGQLDTFRSSIWAVSPQQQRRGRVPNKRAVQPEEDLVRLYLNDVGKYALLTKTDEIQLAQTVEAGRDARVELSESEDLTPSR